MSTHSVDTDNTRQQPFITVVVPAHNEEAGIEVTVRELRRVLDSCDVKSEIIVVDDGSTDGTFDCLSRLCTKFGNLRGIKLSKNFGKEYALLAGLHAAKGDAVITIDADLQHPPSLMPDMIDKWQAGVKVVHAVKRHRTSDTLAEKWRAAIFNKLLVLLGGVDLRNSSDYKLLDRVPVNVIVKELREYKRFYRGLASWVGFRQENVYFDVASRHAGESKWSIRELTSLAVTGIVSFTSAPLRIVTILGILTLTLEFFVTAETLWSWFQGTAVSGFTTIIITLLLLGSFIMISLGILGEYVAKVYDEVKSRPEFLVDQTCGFEEK